VIFEKKQTTRNSLISGGFLWLRGWDLKGPVKNIVAFFGARCCTLSARIFHLLRLAFSAVWRRSPSQPTPSGARLSEIQNLISHIKK